MLEQWRNLEPGSMPENSNQVTIVTKSVASIVENLLQTVKVKKSILACNDLSQSSGVQIVWCNFSEPQSGKDICDRIICPMKSTISSF